MRNSFVFSRQLYEALKTLPPKTYKDIYEAIFKYAFDDEVIVFEDNLSNSLFELLKPQLDKDLRYTDRHSKEYKQWRNAVLKRDKYKCVNCKCNDEKLHAHHIRSFKDYPHLRFSIENGVSLCEKCHRKVHRK